GRLPAGVRPPTGLQGVVDRLVERITREAAAGEVPELLSAATILVGLRVPRELGVQLFRGVRGVRESSTYQAILDEGREDALKKVILRQGRLKFGAAGPAVEAGIQAI